MVGPQVPQVLRLGRRLAAGPPWEGGWEMCVGNRHVSRQSRQRGWGNDGVHRALRNREGPPPWPGWEQWEVTEEVFPEGGLAGEGILQKDHEARAGKEDAG